MKVKTTITATVCLIAMLFLSSCDDFFSEDCSGKGFLKARISEEGPSPATTEEIQVRYYDNYSGMEYTEKLGEPDYFSAENEFLSRISTGEYRFLVYNIFNNRVRNVDDISSIEIYSDTVISNKYALPVIANKQHPVYMGTESGWINREDTTYREFALAPMVQKIVVNVTLVGLSTDHTLTGLEAMLTGVITGRKIYTNQPLPEYAGLIYSFTQIEEAKFTAESYVFGISNNVPNTFKIECLGESFTQYFDIDLSHVLEDFTASGIVIDLHVEIGENMQMKDIYIADWRDIPQSDIQF